MNIFVGNLAFSATDSELRQLFEPYGVVDNVNLITDRDTGSPRGFGFVDMPDIRAAQSAIQGLQGKGARGSCLNRQRSEAPRTRREPRQARW